MVTDMLAYSGMHMKLTALIALQKLVITLFFFCIVALRPKSTAMVIAGWSVHLTTLFPGQA